MTWQLIWEKSGLGDEWPYKGQGSYFGPQQGWGVRGWGEGGTLLLLSKPGRLFFPLPPEGALICVRPPPTASHSVLRYLFSHSVVSDSVRPHGLQHTGLSVLHHLPRFAQVHVHCISDATQPSHPLTPSSPALSLSQHQGLFQWVLDGSHCFNPNPKVLFYFIHHMYHITSPPIGLTLLFTIPTPDSVPGTFSAPSVSCGHCNTLAKLSGLQEHKCIIVQFWRSGAQDQSRC